MNFINWISDLKPLKGRKNIKVLNQASFSFDLSVADLYYSLSNGHTLVALDNEAQNDFSKMFSIIKSEKINVAVMTPTFMKLLLLDSDFKSENFPDFDTVYFCGERLDVPTVKKLYQRFPQMNVINAYGPTEATSAISAIIIEKEMLDMEILPVGDCSNLASEVEIIDDEIVLKGKSVFSGYIGGITGGYYRENNIDCYKTGDLGYIIDDELFCKGRKDNQLKFKGYRIELEDIENNIKLISGIHECIIVPQYKADTDYVKLLKAYIVSDNKEIDASCIRDQLKNSIPEYMIPKIIRFIDDIPVSCRGKVDRRMMAEYDRHKIDII